jgi:hypothetical protein
VRLQQALEESDTANILLCLGVKGESQTNSDDNDSASLTRSVSSVPNSAAYSNNVAKGNIIDQLRATVRAEAALQNQENHQYLRALTDCAKHKDSNGIICASSADSLDMDADTDNDADTDYLTKNSTDNTNRDHLEKKFAPHETEEIRSHSHLFFTDNCSWSLNWYRKERNRVHAKLTRDRKKLFTSRIQQMISSLERSNNLLRCRLRTLAQAGQTSSDTSSDSEESRVKKEAPSLTNPVLSPNGFSSEPISMTTLPMPLQLPFTSSVMISNPSLSQDVMSPQQYINMGLWTMPTGVLDTKGKTPLGQMNTLPMGVVTPSTMTFMTNPMMYPMSAYYYLDDNFKPMLNLETKKS